MSVVREVEAVETSGLAFGALARKYGIKSADTVQTWVRNYGNGSRGKVIRMEKPEAIEQGKKLKERVRERTAGSLPVELALERAYTHIACERAGIEDVSAFKKSGWVAGHQGVATQGEQRVVSVSAVCPPLGMSRQNDDARRRVREAQAVEAGLVTELVRAERRLQPRLGGRKLRVVK